MNELVRDTTVQSADSPVTKQRRPPKKFTRYDDTTKLLKAATDGDEEAWRALIDRFSPLIWSVSRACRLSCTDAQDVHQFVWLTLTQHLNRIREPEALAGWLYKVARNESLRMAGQSARQVPTDTLIEEGTLDDATYADARALLEERNAQLWAAVDQLPPRCRSLLLALAAESQPRYADISSQFDMPIGSVGPTRLRCLERLRRILALTGITQDPDTL
jgi:RNA polymerase sigma factor (sigma-70 family)